jgi:pseudaminic acid synthase
MKKNITINNTKIGCNYPTYIIAEMSANHNKDLKRAKKIVKNAKICGANAVKVQLYTPDTLTIDSSESYFQLDSNSLWHGKSLYELYKEAYMPWEWYSKLKKYATSLNIDLFSTAYDYSSVDFLESHNVPVHKIASFELTDIPLIRKMATTKKPLLISTGMATIEEISEAIISARQSGATELGIFKCTSGYPALPEEMNIKAIKTLAQKFEVPVGLSDHTRGIEIPIAAVTLGANFIEKHLTLNRKDGGLDSSFSIEPKEFKKMVESIRNVEKSLIENKIGPTLHELNNIRYRRSLFVVENMNVGDVFSVHNIRSIRPAYGLHPRHYFEILGKKAKRDINRGTPLSLELIS